MPPNSSTNLSSLDTSSISIESVHLTGIPSGKSTRTLPKHEESNYGKTHSINDKHNLTNGFNFSCNDTKSQDHITNTESDSVSFEASSPKANNKGGNSIDSLLFANGNTMVSKTILFFCLKI